MKEEERKCGGGSAWGLIYRSGKGRGLGEDWKVENRTI
jgi:hypothetical protein